MNEIKKLIASINSNGYKPIYFLMGEEPYYIDYLTNYFITHVVPEEEKAFNQLILYGKDTTINEIISQARQYPFMGNKMLVVVKEAQHLTKSIEELSSYFKSIQSSTILVICYKYKTLDKRRELYKTITKSEHAEVFESAKIKDYTIDSWLKSYVQSENLSIEPKAVSMLVEFLGNDLSKIANEISKLKIVLKESNKITAALVEENIGISKDYNNFEFLKAIVFKDEVKAFDIARYFAYNTKNNPLVVTLGTLYVFFSKLLQYHGIMYKNPNANQTEIAKKLGINPYGLKDYQAAVKNYSMKKTSGILATIRAIDLNGKGVNANINHDDLLKELVIKTLR